MPSTDPVSSITNCYCLIVFYTDPASSSRNAQLNQLDLVIWSDFWMKLRLTVVVFLHPQASLSKVHSPLMIRAGSGIVEHT